MDKISEEVKKFVESFFINLGAVIGSRGNVGEILVISNVPENFERFYGKKSPYSLVFDSAFNSSDVELMTRGSFLLNAMKEYLSSRGETTLLKIEFNEEPRKIIESMFLFKNCKIESINKKIENKYLIRFSFQTNFQYLNEKENIVNDIYVSDGKIINFDNSKFKLIQGKKEDLVVKDIREGYKMAKDSLKPLLDNKISQLGLFLDEKLKKEIERIRLHFQSQFKEYNDAIDKNNKQIEELRKQFVKFKEKGNVSECLNIEGKIERLKEANGGFQDKQKLEVAKKEEEFFIRDETQKHSLNIDTRLINMSLIYYPVFSYNVLLKGMKTGISGSMGVRNVEIKYNPFEEIINPLHCEGCKSIINEINLCSSGHISCKKCLRGCSDCGEDYCFSCLERECFSCGKRLCRKCAKKCISCGKYKCRAHMKTSSRCLSCGEKRDENSKPLFR